MIEERLGYRYAKAVFGLAKEKNLLDDARDDMEVIIQTCNIRDFDLLLKSPIISSSKKRAVFNRVFGGKFKTQFTPELIKIILRKHREMYLSDIALSFVALYDKEKRIVRGEIISAVPMSKSQVREIVQKIEKQTGNRVLIEERVDPSLIGGFVLKVGDTLLDGSISASLNRVKKEFEKNTYVKKY